jgi:hypothetical protein
MESVTSSTAVATAVRANDITPFASLELSKSKWVVTINSPGSEKFSKPIVEGGDGAGLLDLLCRWRANAEQRCRVPVKVVVIQSRGLPNQLTDIAPYVATLLALVITHRRRVQTT